MAKRLGVSLEVEKQGKFTCNFKEKTVLSLRKPEVTYHCGILRIITVVRRAKQGASSQVKDLMFQNLASRNYRVL